MTLDSAISLGSLIAMAGTSITIFACVLGAYKGVITHMTKNEEIIKGMLDRMAKIENNQVAIGKTLAEQNKIIAVIQEQIKYLHAWARGGK